MAYLKNLIVSGSSRFLNKVYITDLDVTGTTSFANITTSGTVNIGTTQANAILNLNGKKAVAGTDTWLRLNDTTAFTSGIYCGTGLLRTDGQFQLGSSGSKLAFTSTNDNSNIAGASGGHALFKIPIEMNGTSYYWDTSGNIKANDVNSSTGQINNLFVPNELRALSYSIETINSLGGAFYVAPTINVPAGNNVNITAISGTTVTASISGSFSLTTFPQAIWAANSKVKVTGKIGGIPIGTCDGYLRAALTTSSIQVTFTYDGAKSLTAANNQASEDVSVMIYSVGADKPIGIYMTAWGDTAWSDETAHNKSSISIYGGTLDSNTAPTTSTPVVRIGNLTGLPAVNESNPQGWGIYTNNGYFDGVVVSKEGKIGGWTLGADRIWSGNFGVANSAMVSVGTSTAGTDTKSIGGSSAINGWTFTSGAKFGVTKEGALYCSDIHATGAINATSGTIGSNGTSANRWQIGSTSIYNQTNSITSTTAGTYIGTDGIRNYKDANTFVNISQGVITAKAVNLTGTITATTGTFGNGTNKITVGNGGTANSAIYYGMTTLNSTTATGFYIGTDGIALGGGKFKVTSGGSAVFKDATLGDPSAYHVSIDNDSLDILNNDTSLASFGETVIIGKETEQNLYIDLSGLKIRSGEAINTQFGSETIIGPSGGQHLTIGSGSFIMYDAIQNPLFSISGTVGQYTTGISGVYKTQTKVVSFNQFPLAGTPIKTQSTVKFTAGTPGTYSNSGSTIVETYDGVRTITITRSTAPTSNVSYQYTYTVPLIYSPVVTIGKPTSDHFVIESGKISANNEYNNSVFLVDINGGESRQDVFLAREDATNKTTTISLTDAYENSTSDQNKVIRVVVSLDVSLKSGYHFSSSSGANEVYQNSSGLYRLKWQEYRYGYIELNSSGSSVLNSDIWQITFPNVLNSSNTAVSITNTLTDNLENITSTSQTNYTITTSLSGTNIIDSVTYTVEVYYAVITTAPSYNCGLRSGTAGAFSSILGNNLYATDDAQVAIGKNNIASKSAFIIGNGSDVYHRSNALTVDWNGNLDIAGALTINTNKLFVKQAFSSLNQSASTYYIQRNFTLTKSGYTPIAFNPYTNHATEVPCMVNYNSSTGIATVTVMSRNSSISGLNLYLEVTYARNELL